MAPPTHDDVTGIGRDPTLLEAFYREHVDSVSRFVARRVDDAHAAADLTTEVFLAAMASAHAYRGGPGGARAWLYGVARNVVAGERRRSAREAEASRRLAGRRLVDADDIGRLVERLDAEAEARRVYLLIRQLPPDDRALLELVAVDGLTTVEAARALGINAVGARVRLHRARRRLAAVIAKQLPATPQVHDAAAARASGSAQAAKPTQAAAARIPAAKASTGSAVAPATDIPGPPAIDVTTPRRKEAAA